MFTHKRTELLRTKTEMLANVQKPVFKIHSNIHQDISNIIKKSTFSLKIHKAVCCHQVHQATSCICTIERLVLSTYKITSTQYQKIVVCAYLYALATFLLKSMFLVCVFLACTVTSVKHCEQKAKYMGCMWVRTQLYALLL